MTGPLQNGHPYEKGIMEIIRMKKTPLSDSSATLGKRTPGSSLRGWVSFINWYRSTIMEALL